MNEFGHSWGMMGFGWLIPLLIIGIVFYLFQDRKKHRSDAQDILDKRYASGGISKEEYEEKSKHLRKNA
jgi:putative membrane protein